MFHAGVERREELRLNRESQRRAAPDFAVLPLAVPSSRPEIRDGAAMTAFGSSTFFGAALSRRGHEGALSRVQPDLEQVHKFFFRKKAQKAQKDFLQAPFHAH